MNTNRPHPAPDRPSPLTRAGLVLAGLLAVGDIGGGLGQLSVGSLLPIEVAVAAIVLGSATLALIPVAWRGKGWAIALIVVFRVVSALTALPAFFAPDVPAAAVVIAAATVLLTATTVVMLSIRRRSRVPAN